MKNSAYLLLIVLYCSFFENQLECADFQSAEIRALFSTIFLRADFTFNRIAGNTPSQNGISRDGIYIAQDSLGTISELHDGKQTPLVLGSIPRKMNHIDELKNSFGLPESGTIGIYTLNRRFERDWAGETQIIKTRKDIKLFKYPTTDFTAPSMVDLLRAVRDLDNRDSYNHGLAYVHCRAGRGRSAVTVAAYLAFILHKAQIVATAEQIEAYLKKCRTHVGLNGSQMAVLKRFQTELAQAGSFENLYAHYRAEIEKRDQKEAIKPY